MFAECECVRVCLRWLLGENVAASAANEIIFFLPHTHSSDSSPYHCRKAIHRIPGCVMFVCAMCFACIANSTYVAVMLISLFYCTNFYSQRGVHRKWLYETHTECALQVSMRFNSSIDLKRCVETLLINILMREMQSNWPNNATNPQTIQSMSC